MTTEVGFFRRTWVIVFGVCSVITTGIGLVSNALNITGYLASDLKQQDDVAQFQPSQKMQRYGEEERQAERQRLIEEERQAEMQRLIEEGTQQAVLRMQEQQQEEQRRAEQARQFEVQRLFEQNQQQAKIEQERIDEQNAQQALLQMQAQQEREAQRVLERNNQALHTVQFYFESVNRHQINKVIDILANPTDKTRKVLENTEWVRLNDIALASADDDQAIVNVRFQGKSKDTAAREYAGSIPLQWRDQEWKIVTLKQLQQVSNTVKPPVTDHAPDREEEYEGVTETEVDSPDESVANAPSVTQGDRYIYESIYPNNPKSNNKTERVVAAVTNKKILLYSKNLTSDSIRQLEYTPEWNFLSSKNKEGAGLTYQPPLKYFKFPLTTGDSWNQDSTETNTKTGKKRKHTIKASVGDWEEVTVPAGTFTAIKVTAQTTVIDLETGKMTVGKDISWYAPDVGRSVKSLLTSTSPDGQQEKQTIQLLEYHPVETGD